MALTNLPAKNPNTPIDSGHLLAYLQEEGVSVSGDTVIANADGSVVVDTEDDLTAVWAAYEPPAEVSVASLAETLAEEAAETTTVADLRDFIVDRLIPALLPAE